MAKKRKRIAASMIAGVMGAELKIWPEKPMPQAYRELDTDLARDNIENDMTFADLQDLQ